MKVLHIAAHLGGGAGKAISGIAIQGQREFEDTHRILLLQPPEKDGYVQACQAHGVEVCLWDGGDALFRWADVIVVSWWDHPAMAPLLRSFPETQAPVLLWSHVNGCHYPMLPYPFADSFDGLLFTSPYSLQNPCWTAEERRHLTKKSEIVWGMGQFAPEQIAPKRDYHSGGQFTVGYVGTLNYGKLHPQFTAYCQAVCQAVPAARFVLAGDPNETLERDIHRAGLADRVTFTGYVADVPAVMRGFDVFGYLLHPEHYGTTENVLLEAMACGLPVVALRQNVEQFTVPPEAGYLVRTPEDYQKCLEFLWSAPAERERLGRGARAHVLARYRAAENTGRFRAACLRAAETLPQKRDRSFLGDSPWEWFLFFLGEADRRRMERAQACLAQGGDVSQVRRLLKECAPILREERKSSLRHFAAVYPQDEILHSLNEQMEQE